MKLQKKMLINFGVMFFITINIFAYFLIQTTYNTNFKKVIDSSFASYSLVYSNIKTGENLKNLFLTNKEILQHRTEDYLRNLPNENIALEFRDLNKEIIYSSSKNKVPIKDEIFDVKNNKVKYLITKNGDKTYLIINNKIILNGSGIYFTYIDDISFLKQDRLNNIYFIFTINILLAIIIIIIIYSIAKEITKPIEILINNIKEIINGNYTEKLNYSSNVYEFKVISEQFNLMNDEIENKLRLLKEQNQSKQRFIDNLTHEIRTPLTSIIGYSSLMVNKKVTDLDLMRDSFININREGKRILSLTSKLVKLITLDKTVLHKENIDLYDTLREVKSTFEPKLKEKDITLEVKGCSYHINVDKELFMVLITNLIDNSIKALNDRAEKIIILEIMENSLKIEDTGVGIEEKELKKILEPFYMIDKSRQSSINGFGLGLSICKQILEIHHMNWSIESTFGKGTKIIILFNDEVSL
ncbi:MULTISPECIES: sensor histidine kinase [unclassified Clostridium]|uniref:sensor histidine kinase n=1 Tax=unclassified Clostridium TaxID=2614128 RepID=UPI0025BD6C88|nr:MULTISPECIES: HAMP domain-containing sensor histidine kinase [unclassified Clostridium]